MKVIVPSFTWIASVSCIMHNNAVPIFADVDPKTFTLDPDDVRRKITHRTKAIIAVDLYGHPVNLKELLAIAREHNIVLIEDSAQATGGAGGWPDRRRPCRHHLLQLRRQADRRHQRRRHDDQQPRLLRARRAGRATSLYAFPRSSQTPNCSSTRRPAATATTTALTASP